MSRPSIKELLSSAADGRQVLVRGWVRTRRQTKAAVFLEVNDGSCMSNIQCVFSEAAALAAQDALGRAGTGASVRVEGALVPSPASGQKAEVAVSSLEVIGEAPAESYPLQKKAHSLEFLREIAHLRARTNTFGAVAPPDRLERAVTFFALLELHSSGEARLRQTRHFGDIVVSRIAAPAPAAG